MNVVVVGAGVNGLATAWQLARRGAKVLVLERFRVGHDRGSSHGASRITRTSYRDARYARLAHEAQREDWPQLERDAGETLVHAAAGLFAGPAGGQIDDYVRATADAQVPVDRVGVAEARRRFPQFAFADDPTVLVDRSAGVIDAAGTVRALARLARGAGAVIREECEVADVRATPSGVEVDVMTDAAVVAVEADRAVVTAGAWVGRLVPSLSRRLSVARQTVGYFAPTGDASDFRLPRFPVWVWLGREEHDHLYGLPEFGRPGLKAARHATHAGGDDPDRPPEEPPVAELDDVRAFLARELAAPPGELLGWERCLYTNEPSQDFVVGPLPGAEHVLVGAACSGHAFKFAPLTGRVLAELALTGRASSPAFGALAAAFRPRSGR